MNSVLCLGIFLLGSLLLPSTSGFVVEPLYGRNNFNLFSLLPFASTRVTQSQVTSILNRLTALETTNADLQNQILALSSPRCMPSAITSFGAKIVSGICLSVETGPLKFSAAQTKCAAQGGVLAQPSFKNANFFKQLSNAFKTKVTSLSALGMYIGIVGGPTVVDPATNSYQYLIGRAPIPADTTISPVWTLPLPTNPIATNVAIVNGTPADKTKWLLGDIDGSTATGLARGFICQYPSF